MDIIIEAYDSLCELKEFKINGIDADRDDFGRKVDESRETAEEYGCGDMRFTRQEPSMEILAKYSISPKEYDDICSILEKKLSFGRCGWCI